jgi:hypothetical protein
MINCGKEIFDGTFYGGAFGLSLAVALDFRPATLVGDAAYLGSFIALGAVVGGALALERKVWAIAKSCILGAGCGLIVGTTTCKFCPLKTPPALKALINFSYATGGAGCGQVIALYRNRKETKTPPV